MPPKSEDSPSVLTGEESKRALEGVLKRYGIHPNAQPTAQKQQQPLAAPRIHPEIITSEPAISNVLFSRPRQRRLGAPCDLQKRRNPKQSATAEVLRKKESPHGPEGPLSNFQGFLSTNKEQFEPFPFESKQRR
jgi:hypothetical protein